VLLFDLPPPVNPLYPNELLPNPPTTVEKQPNAQWPLPPSIDELPL
jgi:hypothetical protein